jgi:hypothetical protein
MLTSEISARLSSESLVTTGYTVVRGKVPATPDKVIVLRETGGAGPERFLGGSASVEQPALQVIVRGAKHDYDGPRLQIEQIYQAAMGWGAFTASSVRYLGLTPLQAPTKLRDDENERVEFVVNFLVQKELSSTS